MTEYISNFGDQAVVLPLATVVALGLAGIGWWRGFAGWVVAVVGTLGTMLVLKLAGAVLAHRFGGHIGGSPSGHVAAACMVYGGFAMLLLRGRIPGATVALIPAAIIVVIGYTRIQLGAHTPAEVVIGALVGSAGLAALAIIAGPRPRVQAWPLFAAAVGTVLAFHGLHIPAEQAIQNAAWVL